jgi:hypothetical protein
MIYGALSWVCGLFGRPHKHTYGITIWVLLACEVVVDVRF